LASDKPDIRVVSAEIQRDDRYLITQRSPKAVLPLLWEFPGGRVRDGEPDEAALHRALKMRLGVDAAVGKRLLEVKHDYEGWTVTLAVYRCELGEQEPWAAAVAAFAWAGADELADYPFPGADQRTVELLLRES
jgi:8-oxo-dGTP diphosphatase